MNDIRRTILLFILSVSLVFLWDGWQRYTGHPSMFSPEPAKTQTADAAAKPQQDNQALPPAAGSAGAAAATPAAPAPGTPSGITLKDGDTVTINTDVVEATFAKQGATLVKLRLKNYPTQADKSRSEMLFDYSPERTYWAQSGLIGAGGKDLPNQFTAMQWVQGPVTPGSDGKVSVVFQSPVVNGVQLNKTFVFDKDTYAVQVKHEVVNTSGEAVSPFLFLQLLRDGNPPDDHSSFYSTFTGPGFYTEEAKYHKINFKDIDKNSAVFPSAYADGWVGMIQHYFVSAWVVPNNLQRHFKFSKVSNNLYSAASVIQLPSIAPGQRYSLDAQLYAGPQLENVLAATAPGLELVKDYGFLTLLAKPLYWVLHHIHSILGNWGWSIVVLVILLKLAFFKLNASAYKSMAKMKAVAPRVQLLRDQHKDDPQKMQQEMMRIYREEKVNPVGGCLPIVLQMPFFISLYWVLLSTVEMRGAPWMLWISDLSVRDPYFILPLLMAASSMLQVALNPKPADPMQAKMMWMMPLIFSVMFFFFPAGLVLYWLTNNILSIAQQWIINRKLGVV
ncbi:membrane protein insertase YidC [Amphibiibacter pelophylacis]|uniref:Membrane protein insertase YidC n=1 Tax=Amphibiibacter pelophylacis TaxID=1799477 RepID=A0ACC6P1H7_9BURK